MLKSCSKCGNIHDIRYKCNIGKIYKKTDIDRLRSTSKWTHKSIEIRERSNYLCAVCKDKGIYNYKDVEIHHIIKLNDRPDLMFEDDNLICLCKLHHKQADEGKINIDYLLELAKKRDNE